MSNRTVTILVGVAVLLALLASFGNRDRSPTEITSGGRFLPGLEATLNDTDEVTLIKAGNETVATLQRTVDGWVVMEREGYPADVAKIRDGLLALAEARLLEAKTSNPERYDRLGVEDVQQASAGGIAITIEGAGASVTVIVGDAEGDYRYARRGEETESYLIDRNPQLGLDTADWLDADILDIDGDRVQRVTVTHPDGEAVLVMKADQAQTNLSVEGIPEGRELLYDSVANVMGSVLEGLQLDDVARSNDSEEATIVEFRTFDGLMVTAHAMSQDDENWVSFEASYERAQESADEETAESEGDDPGADLESEAADVNARLGGWQFMIPTFKYEQMTRRMEDLLQSESDSGS